MNSGIPGYKTGDANEVPFDLDGYTPMSVVHQIRASILGRIKDGRPILPEIDGREDSKKDVIRALLSGAHPYLISEEGTGKTRLAKALTSLLPDIPVIKGCPYHDDPAWPRERLCPRCGSVNDPAAEFGIEFLPASKRFSRIQGNEYTNEAKLLGLKDIQLIAQGKSLSDPEAFTGTGIFKANRGILFVDEMPAIRTKIQVLLHPVLEEKQAILEEYNWHYPLDLIFVATGNPMGYSHVNDIPRPLLDRLELVYMAMPEEDIEKKIMLQEGFREFRETPVRENDSRLHFYTPEDVGRKAKAPWWIVDIVNKAVRHSRTCRYVEKRPSIRAGIRALEHTVSSVEIDNHAVANVNHAFQGIRLALRGRIGLRADLIDYDQPVKAFAMVDRLSEDFVWNAFENLARERAFLGDLDRKQAGVDLENLMADETDLSAGQLPDPVLAGFSELSEMIRRMCRVGLDANSGEAALYGTTDPDIRGELNYSALEMIAGILVHEKVISEMKLKKLFFAGEYNE